MVLYQKRGRVLLLLVLFSVSIMLAFSVVAARVNIGIYKNDTTGKVTIVARVSNPSGGGDGGDGGNGGSGGAGGCTDADCPSLPPEEVPPLPEETSTGNPVTSSGRDLAPVDIDVPPPTSFNFNVANAINDLFGNILSEVQAGEGVCDSTCMAAYDALSAYFSGNYEAAGQILSDAGIGLENYPSEYVAEADYSQPDDSGEVSGGSGADGGGGGGDVDSGGDVSGED